MEVQFKIKSWDENDYNTLSDESKLTRAAVVYDYTSGIVGEGKVEYLMYYRTKNSGTFTALEHVTGKLGDKSGGFILRHDGTHSESGVKDTATIVPGSGTGDLTGISGKMDIDLPGHQDVYTVTLSYQFD